MQHLQMWILKKTKTNVGKITFLSGKILLDFNLEQSPSISMPIP
jgi:hypothetical protein